MLRAMLTSHPLVAVPPESYFTTKALRRSARYEARGAFDRVGLVNDIRRSSNWESWDVDDAALDAVGDDSSLADVPAVLRAVYELYAQREGKVFAVDKTPQHTEHVAVLNAAFPRSRFVHLVRDGRDVLPSLQAMPHFPTDFGDATLFWRHRAVSGRNARRLVGPDRYHELRYEDLIIDPERHLRSLCVFLELEYHESMLEYPLRADSVIQGTAGAAYHGNLRRAPTRTRDWRHDLSDREVQRFEALAGDALGMFGYDRGPAPALRFRAEALGRHWKAVAGQRSRSLRARLRRPGRAARAVPW